MIDLGIQAGCSGASTPGVTDGCAHLRSVAFQLICGRHDGLRETSRSRRPRRPRSTLVRLDVADARRHELMRVASGLGHIAEDNRRIPSPVAVRARDVRASNRTRERSGNTEGDRAPAVCTGTMFRVLDAATVWISRSKRSTLKIFFPCASSGERTFTRLALRRISSATNDARHTRRRRVSLRGYSCRRGGLELVAELLSHTGQMGRGTRRCQFYGSGDALPAGGAEAAMRKRRTARAPYSPQQRHETTASSTNKRSQDHAAASPNICRPPHLCGRRRRRVNQ